MQLQSLPQHQILCQHNKVLDLSTPQIMGILNVTPDSFSDGGQYLAQDALLKRAEQMLQEGASMIDIGGESTRPHAQPVSEAEELDRISFAVDLLAQRFDCLLSIDTSKPSVFKAAYAQGAHIWNDVRALQLTGARQTAAALNCPVILMHARGTPDTMDTLTQYDNFPQTILSELAHTAQLALDAGVAAQHIMVDPGFGFAKTGAQNIALLKEIWQFKQLGYPLLVGVSRKRFLGDILGGAPVTARLYTGLGAAMLAVQQGASIIRTHDVKPTADMLKVWTA